MSAAMDSVVHSSVQTPATTKHIQKLFFYKHYIQGLTEENISRLLLTFYIYRRILKQDFIGASYMSSFLHYTDLLTFIWLS